jgi:hypothetical protein
MPFPQSMVGLRALSPLVPASLFTNPHATSPSGHLPVCHLLGWLWYPSRGRSPHLVPEHSWYRRCHCAVELVCSLWHCEIDVRGVMQSNRMVLDCSLVKLDLIAQ